MNASIVGIIAGVLCTLSFVPQVVKIYQTRDAGSLSYITFSLFAIGVFLWLTYGIMLKDYVIIIANGITLMLAVVIIIMKIVYEKNRN